MIPGARQHHIGPSNRIAVAADAKTTKPLGELIVSHCSAVIAMIDMIYADIHAHIIVMAGDVCMSLGCTRIFFQMRTQRLVDETCF